MTQRKVRVVLTHAEAAALRSFASCGMSEYESVTGSPYSATDYAAASRALKKLNEARIKADADGRRDVMGRPISPELQTAVEKIENEMRGKL